MNQEKQIKVAIIGCGHGHLAIHRHILENHPEIAIVNLDQNPDVVMEDPPVPTIGHGFPELTPENRRTMREHGMIELAPKPLKFHPPSKSKFHK